MNNYKKIYDKIQQKPIIPKKTYPLNKENIKKYINACPLRYRYILQKLFDNTKYISYRTFKFVLYNNFKEFIYYCKIKNIKKISLYLDNIDYNNITLKSNFWVSQHFYQYVKKNNINIKINIIYNKYDIKYLDPEELILILDDCVYTGKQLISVLKNDINQGVKLNIYIIIAFITKDAIEKIKNTDKYYRNNIILSKNHTFINNFYSYLTEEEQLLASSLNIENKYPIYFDHKLADTVSTYTAIYSGKVINKNKYINVITNCEHIKYIDEYEPKCPISSYKFDNSHIDIYKDYIKYKSSSNSISSISSIKSDIKKKKKKKKKQNDNNIFLVHYNDYIAFINSKKDEIKINDNDKLIEIKNYIKNNSIKLPEISYNFNKDRIKKYYKLISPEIVPIIKKVIKNTIHISHIDYLKNLNDKIIKLKDIIYSDNTNIVVKLFIFDINSTNRWVSQYIYNNINVVKHPYNNSHINLIIINDFKDINYYDFVIYADDYIHTGFYIKNFFNIKKYFVPFYRLYILASYINYKIYHTIISKNVYIPYNNYQLYAKIVYPLNKYLKKEELDLFYKYTNYNLDNKYAIYADHNIYDDKYIPLIIYKGIFIKNNKKEFFPLFDKFPISLYKIDNKSKIERNYNIDISGNSNEYFETPLTKEEKKKIKEDIKNQKKIEKEKKKKEKLLLKDIIANTNMKYKLYIKEEKNKKNKIKKK